MERPFKKILRNISELFNVAIALTILSIPAKYTVAATLPLTDMTIKNAVEDKLSRDNAVPYYLVDVDVNKGIVILNGSVDNLLAKERAAKNARTVKGVRSVVNRLEVNPSTARADQQIREDVKDALLTDPATDFYKIDVEVKDNVVTLSGTVESWQEKELCETVVKGIKGVKDIKDAITISWRENRSDNEIKAEVQKTLKWDAYVDDALINVKVRDRKVRLRGIVGSAAEKEWAEWDAHVYGVRSVDSSRLKVQRGARDEDMKGSKYDDKSANEIENAIKEALLYDPRVSMFNVTPETTGNIVTLRGTVDTLKARRAAEQDARNTVGVTTVCNRIKIRAVKTVNDRKVEEDIRRALKRDPYVERHELTILVKKGIVNLYGIVDTYFEKSETDDVASRVQGVILVNNNITVREKDRPYIYDPYVDENYLIDSGWIGNIPQLHQKSDRQIKKDVEREFFWSPFVDGDDIHVTVNDGMVILIGTVKSWSEYNAAAKNAYEGGAVYVDNDLVVD